MNPSVNNDKVKALSADLQPLLLVTAPLTNVLLNKCADYDRYVIVYPKAPLTCKSVVDWGGKVAPELSLRRRDKKEQVPWRIRRQNLCVVKGSAR